MRACIQAGTQGKRRAQQLSGLYQQSAKRPRLEENAEGDAELMHACRAYVLRWFARRNRRVTTVLFASNQDNLHLDVGCSRVDRYYTQERQPRTTSLVHPRSSPRFYQEHGQDPPLRRGCHVI
jgi:hypothetical protein